MHTNKLISEKSPYLLQHANNPVNWFPWGDEAFNKAREEDKPIFLSIGYSTCHWCHVMEKESFEDAETAALINNSFVAIKVDREERPDIDGIYMSVCQMLTGNGGWPLTIIMTPDKKPFFAGTYFPKYDRFGKSGLLTIIPKIMNLWNTRHQELIDSSEEITEAVRNASKIIPGKESGEDLFHKAFEDYKKRYDPEFGGFGNAPKFPTPHNLTFLLRYWKRYKNNSALDIVENTLIQMRRGGIYDQIGFGFHRYSTDREWLVPHFEKMLYDQALLIPVYLETYQATNNNLFLETAEEILKYVMRDMTSPSGGFYSAEDADSEGEEGKFYLWTEDELRGVLSEDQDYAISLFNIKPDGNWNDTVSNNNGRTNILHLNKKSGNIEKLEYPDNVVREKNLKIGRLLFDQREKRVHPFKDDKILTDWNSLMITAFSKAAQVTGNEVYVSYARTGADFISEFLTDDSGRLLHRHKDGNSSISGNLDDYAFYVQALLDLYETNFSISYLDDAKFMLDLALNDFWDEETGGFFFSAKDNIEAIANQKEIYDGAIPSGNSVMILNLLRMSKITADIKYEEKAAMMNRAFSTVISRSPSSFSQALSGYDFAIGPSLEIVISSNEFDHDANMFVKEIRKYYLPSKIVVLKTASNNLQKIAPYVPDQNPINEKAVVYLCRNFSCELPIIDYKKIGEALT